VRPRRLSGVAARPLNFTVRSHMSPLRLEELLRIAIIAATAALGGIVVMLAEQYLASHRGTAVNASDFLLLLATTSAIFAVAFPASVLTGLILHLLLRRFSTPRGLLLPVFLTASYLVGCLVTSRQWEGFLPLVLGVGAIAWLLYSFGPVRLWHFEFDPEQHSDF
jgi:hypothetical protein